MKKYRHSGEGISSFPVIVLNTGNTGKYRPQFFGPSAQYLAIFLGEHHPLADNKISQFLFTPTKFSAICNFV